MTSELRVERWSLPAAELGPLNPLPPLRAADELHATEEAGLPQHMLDSLAFGHPATILPYMVQDGYGRERRPRDFTAAVLENEFLRATFLLEVGGRLWSLVHKPSGRELLDVNPVFQPANLAIRNAWFSGGVEWNIGVIGHSPFTCDPVFAARVEGPGRTPILRLYEWERIRQVPFQVDAYLPEGSPVLLVRVRIRNPHDREIPMYWWSNVAVPETPETRVVVPADATYRFDYAHGLEVLPLPEAEGADITYATNVGCSADFFYHVRQGQRPWIATLDGDGRGLVQVSTDRLRGRKLFVWGMGTGGRNWQDFLSEPGHAYIEVQAGLGKTQMEYLRMPARADWSWLEAYGLMEAEAATVHGADWTQVRRAVEEALEGLVSRAELEAEHERGGAFADRPPVEILQRGSGWGALERKRREAAGEPAFCSRGLVFEDESLGEEQLGWVRLLGDGVFPPGDPAGTPRGVLVQREWQVMLEEAAREGRGDNWLGWLHLGVMRYYWGDRSGACQAWERSLEQAPTVWALRNLGVAAVDEGRFEEAAERYVSAVRGRADLMPLVVECGRVLIDVGQPARWLALLDEIDEVTRSAGRVRLLEAQAALAVGDLERVEQVFADRPVVSDLREGEVSLSTLWFEFHERRLSVAEALPIDESLRARVRREFPVPRSFDYRMAVDDV